MKWARLREMIVDLFITISLCIKWLNLPWEIFHFVQPVSHSNDCFFSFLFLEIISL